MKLVCGLFLLLCSLTLVFAQSTAVPASTPGPLPVPDERFKTDLLLVVAHPDDETGVSAYLAQLMDQHKRVAVLYLTHGEAGHNNMGPERAASLGAAREMELRHALTKLGIQNVWFLSGRDTPSQNVLQSLAVWRHGLALEDVVRMVRLTRPEVIVTWMPGFHIGENHGDHQASGVLATEAFDISGDPAAFPTQLAGPTKINETLLDGLQPWQVKKIYYFPDASDENIYKDAGPEIDTTAISPTRKLPYWRLALETFTYHLTQYNSYIDRVTKMDEAQLEKQASNWGQPLRFVLGKSRVGGSVKGDVFEGMNSPVHSSSTPVATPPAEPAAALTAELGGPWAFYRRFWHVHGLDRLPHPAMPEISIKRGATLLVPLELHNNTASAKNVTVSLVLPEGWTAQAGAGSYVIAANTGNYLQVTADAPKAEGNAVQEIECRATADGATLADIKIKVRLTSSGLPQN